MRVLLPGVLAVACATPDPARERDRELQTVPTSDMDETQRWAEDDLEC